MLHKHEAVRKCEVNQRTDSYRDHVGDESIEPHLAYEDKHQEQIARKRHRPARKVEAQQHQGRSRLRAVSPGPSPVPDEVMKHTRLYRKRGRRQVVQPCDAQQQCERRGLHKDACCSYRAKPGPAINGCFLLRQLILSEKRRAQSYERPIIKRRRCVLHVSSIMFYASTLPHQVLRRCVSVERRQQHYD